MQRYVHSGVSSYEFVTDNASVINEDNQFSFDAGLAHAYLLMATLG